MDERNLPQRNTVVNPANLTLVSSSSKTICSAPFTDKIRTKFLRINSQHGHYNFCTDFFPPKKNENEICKFKIHGRKQHNAVKIELKILISYRNSGETLTTGVTFPGHPVYVICPVCTGNR